VEAEARMRIKYSLVLLTKGHVLGEGNASLFLDKSGRLKSIVEILFNFVQALKHLSFIVDCFEAKVLHDIFL